MKLTLRRLSPISMLGERQINFHSSHRRQTVEIGQNYRLATVATFLPLALALVIIIGCSDKPATIANKQTLPSAPTAGSNNEKLFGADLIVGEDSALETEPTLIPINTGVLFTEVAQELGLDFVYQNGEAGQSLMVEAVGGGVGVLDYDRNGKPDLLFSQGGDPTEQSNQTRPHAALFRNDWGSHSSGNVPFQNVGRAAGIGAYGYGQGVAVGDFNADGFDDVYLTNVGQNTLLQNMGDGTFHEESNTLYRNLGASGFQDVTGRVGLHTPTLQSLGFGTVMQDFDCDGQEDLSHEQSLVFGLGDHQGSCRVSVDWSDGTTQVIENVQCNRHHVVEQ